MDSYLEKWMDDKLPDWLATCIEFWNQTSILPCLRFCLLTVPLPGLSGDCRSLLLTLIAVPVIVSISVTIGLLNSRRKSRAKRKGTQPGWVCKYFYLLYGGLGRILYVAIVLSLPCTFRWCCTKWDKTRTGDDNIVVLYRPSRVP